MSRWRSEQTGGPGVGQALQLFELRYERADGHFRTIIVRAPSAEEARQITDARLDKLDDQDEYTLARISEQETT